jgi:hypothetical protein
VPIVAALSAHGTFGDGMLAGAIESVSMRRRLRLIVLAAGPLALACTDGSTVSSFVGTVSRSQYFEYHDHAAEPLCPTLLDDLDRHAALVGGKIGLTLDPNDPIRFYKFNDKADLAANSTCNLPENGACSDGYAIASTTYFDAHEQAHSYVYRAWGGFSIGLLNEGEAVAMSCVPDYASGSLYLTAVSALDTPWNALGRPDWRSLLELYGNSAFGYAAAGFWITSLAQRFGWPKVEELHRRVPPGTSQADLEIQFATVFPTSMDESWSTALGSRGAAPCQDDWRCTATPLAVGEDAPADCDGEMHRSVVVTDQAGVVLTMGGASDALLLRACGDPTAPSYALSGWATTRTTHYFPLPPGTYTLFGNPTPTDILFDGYFLTALVGDACATAGTVTLDPTQTTVVDFPIGPLNGWIRLDGGGQRYEVAGPQVYESGRNSGAVCDSCDPAASCVPIPWGGDVFVTIPDGAAVHFDNASAGDLLSNDWGDLLIRPAPPLPDGGAPLPDGEAPIDATATAP